MEDVQAEFPAPALYFRSRRQAIGMSIVGRLCDMLDASMELKSVHGVGTSFRILFPRQYS